MMLGALLATAAHALTALLAAADEEQFDPDKVSPGPIGFAVVALLAIALFFLGLDLVRRLRRSRFRAEIQAELAEELAAKEAAEAAGEASDAGDGAPDAELGREGAAGADPRPDND